MAACDAGRVGPLDEVRRGTSRADVCGWRAYGRGLDSIRQGTCGIALVYRTIQKVNSRRARRYAGLASSRGYERSSGWAADGSCNDVSTCGEASIGSGVQVLLVVAVCGVHIALANSDRSGVDRRGVDILAACDARGVGPLNKSSAERAEVRARCSESGGLLSKWKSASGVALIDCAIHKVDAGCARVLAHN